MNRIRVGALAATGLLVAAANSAVVNYTSYSSWSAAVGSFMTIDFTGLASGTTVDTQYAGVGATFSRARSLHDISSFLNDGYGVYANQGDPLVLQLSTAATAIGTHFPGGLMYKLYMDSTLVGTSQHFGGVGLGFFGGIVSDVKFNKVEFYDYYADPGYYDDIRFSTGEAAVPGPAAALPFAIGMLALKRRKR